MVKHNYTQMIHNQDSLERLKTQADYSADIIYCDPPYALWSEVIIRADGKVDYKKASDFMNKWDMPTGEWREQRYKEAMRVLKHWGYCLMFGMDRQLLLFKYYASLAGFTEKQSLYWYFISNFPKATDLSKMIDKNAGAEREVVGQDKCGKTAMMGKMQDSKVSGVIDITAPSSPLAQKYDWYKYSIAPLKQTNETIMVFQKPYKTGSCLHDTLAYENGDESITCGALDIDWNRVAVAINTKDYGRGGGFVFRGDAKDAPKPNEAGRYPSQTFCDSQAGAVLDKQSGKLNGGVGRANRKTVGGGNITFEKIGIITETETKDTWWCSKILHKCDYEKWEHDLYFYVPKVSKSERNAGCEEMEYKSSASADFRPNHTEKALQWENGNPYWRWTPLKNNHPTLKPISLNHRILSLFKTPNPQKVLYPFAWSGSEIIGWIKAWFHDREWCELNPEYIEIANARIEHWKNKKAQQTEQKTLFN